MHSGSMSVMSLNTQHLSMVGTVDQLSGLKFRHVSTLRQERSLQQESYGRGLLIVLGKSALAAFQ
jgi:hypothetical protein